MGYRRTLQAAPETIQDQEIAAGLRLREALVLYANGEYHTAIYIAGLSAEMYLKTACFFLDGAAPANPVAPRIAPTRVKKGQLHSLLFWSRELVRLRRWRRLAPVPSPFVLLISDLYEDWFIEMRYRPGSADDILAARFIERVEWLAANHARLRS